MDSILINYSDFINDDGGFEKPKKDLENLGKELVKIAEQIAKDVSSALNLGDEGGIDEVEKQTEGLLGAFKKLQKARESFNDVEKEYQKLQKDAAENNADRIKSLASLDKKLNDYRKDLKQVNQFEKEGKEIGEDLNKLRVEAQINIKKTQGEIRKLQKEVIKSNELSKDEQKILEANQVLLKEEVKTRDEIRERIKALRIVSGQLNITTEEGREKLVEYNAEIDDLTDLLSASSDQFIQNKINIGNYEEGITNALKTTDIFATGIGGLDSVIGGLLGSLLLTRSQLEELEKTTKGNTNALQRLTIGFGKLNKTLKVGIIGAVLIAISALASAFGNTRAGAANLERVMQTVNNVFVSFGNISKIVFTSIPDLVKNAVNSLNPFSKKTEETGKKVEDVWNEIKEAVKSGAEAVKIGLDNIDRAFRLEDRIRRISQEVERLTGELTIAQGIAGDSTKSLSTQLLANQKALELQVEIGENQKDIAEAQLKAINQRIIANAKLNSSLVANIDPNLKAVQFAQETLRIAEKQASNLKIDNQLLEEQQSAVLAVQQAENELNETRRANAQERREIQRDLFEQNLDLLIDLIDREKNLSEQFVNDVAQNFEARVNEFNTFLVKFRDNAQKELDEFTNFAQQSGLDLDFKVNFDENGDLEVFVNDTQLAITDIKTLNSQLQGLGINEITINRFREFIQDAQDGVRDFRDLNKELVNAGIEVRELRNNLAVSDSEVTAYATVQAEIDNLIQRSRGRISKKERQRILAELEDLEERKTSLATQGENKRLENRRKALNEELKTVKEGSSREAEILTELNGITKKFQEQNTKIQQDRIKTEQEAAIARIEAFEKELQRIGNLVLDKVLEVSKERIAETQKGVDKQETLIEKQEERARLGLTNTLKFEQEELARREAELIKRQKRQQTLEKVKSLYTSYSNYVGQGTDGGEAITKTLRDFAILEGIAASFKDGGIVGKDGYDHVRTNSKGITLGKSHNVNGGVLAYHQGGEGFFSRDEVRNMGENTFYHIKSLAGKGLLTENYISSQKQQFTKEYVATPVFDNRVITKLDHVKAAIESIPGTKVDVAGFVNGTLEAVETIERKNHVKRNRFKAKKARI